MFRLIQTLPSERQPGNDLRSLLSEAEKFLTRLETPVTSLRSELYTSVLPFYPTSAILRLYGHLTQGPKVLRAPQSSLGWAARSHSISNLALAPDDTAVATAENGSVCFFKNKASLSLSVPVDPYICGIVDLAFFSSPHGLKAGAVTEWGALYFLNPRTGAVIGETTTHRFRNDDINQRLRRLAMAAFSPDAKRVVLGHFDGIVEMYGVDHDRLEIQLQYERSTDSSCPTCTFSPDGGTIIIGARDGGLQVWNSATSGTVSRVTRDRRFVDQCFAISPASTVFASGTGNGEIGIWDLKIGDPTGGNWHGRQPIEAMTFNVDGTLLITASMDSTLRLWDARTCASVGKVMIGHNGPVSCLTLAQEGRVIVSGSWDTTIRLWDTSNGEALGEALQGHKDIISRVVACPGGTLLSASADGTVRSWDISTGAALQASSMNQGDVVSCLAFSPNGRLIASGSCNGSLSVWNAEDGSLIGTRSIGLGHYRTRCLAWSLDSQMLCSGHGGYHLQLWDANTAQPIGRLMQSKPGKGRIRWIAFSEDKRWLVAFDTRHRRIVWDIQTQQRASRQDVHNLWIAPTRLTKKERTRNIWLPSGCEETSSRLVNHPSAYQDLGLLIAASSEWSVDSDGCVYYGNGSKARLFRLPEEFHPSRPWLVKGHGNRLAIGARHVIILDVSAYV